MTYLSYTWTGDPDATPWVLLHAMPFDSTMFDTVRHVLPAVITFDAPGFGSSISGAELDDLLGADSPSLDTYAQAVAHDLEELGVTKYHVGGVSMGGAVSVALLEYYPGYEGLALMDTNIGADTDEARQKRLDAALKADDGDASSVLPMSDTMTSKATQTERPEVYEDIKARLRAVKPESLAWMQRAMAARPDRTGSVSKHETKLLLVRGAEDPTFTDDMVAALAKEYPATAVTKAIAGAGHFTPLETPEELGQILSSFHSQYLA